VQAAEHRVWRADVGISAAATQLTALFNVRLRNLPLSYLICRQVGIVFRVLMQAS
jgi:hypothetical protein